MMASPPSAWGARRQRRATLCSLTLFGVLASAMISALPARDLDLAALATGQTPRPPLLPWPMEVEHVYKRHGSPDSRTSKRAQRIAPHLGIDLTGAPHAPVYASEAGTVTFVDFVFDPDLPRTQGGCAIQSAGRYPRSIWYLHLDPASIVVRVGDTVEPGDLLGEVAQWGTHRHPAHLHLQVSEKSEIIQSKGWWINKQRTTLNPESIFVPLPDDHKAKIGTKLTTGIAFQTATGTYLAHEGEKPKFSRLSDIEVDVCESVSSKPLAARYMVPPKSIHAKLTRDADDVVELQLDLSVDDAVLLTRALTYRTQCHNRLSYSLRRFSRRSNNAPWWPAEGLPEGEYALEVWATDSVARAGTRRKTRFIIVP